MMKFEPELLRFENGMPITEPGQWPARREELLEILRREVYGYSPAAPDKVTGDVLNRQEKFCSGQMSMERISIVFETDLGSFSFPIQLFIPYQEQPVPVFVLLNFRPDVFDKYYPLEEIADNGFALAVIHYNDVTADADDWNSGLAGMYSREKYNWGKIGMWAFAASRVLDYLFTRPEIDPSNAAVIGHSRLGKTALWCAAQDERFRFGISNNSGSGGAAYNRAKVPGNERICDCIPYKVPFWYCSGYPEWGNKIEEMPFDQHFLLAAIAPRYVCVGSAAEDLWAGPVQEQASCLGASPAWELLGLPGYIGKNEPAAVGDDFSEGHIGYHLRDGVHFLSRRDWISYMNFVKAHMMK